MSNTQNDVPENYWKLIDEMYESGDEISLMLLGLEMTPKPFPIPGGQMVMVPGPTFFTAIFRKALPEALVVDLQQKIEDGSNQLMTDVPLQWRFIRLMGKRGSVSVSSPRIKM